MCSCFGVCLCLISSTGEVAGLKHRFVSRIKRVLPVCYVILLKILTGPVLDFVSEYFSE